MPYKKSRRRRLITAALTLVISAAFVLIAAFGIICFDQNLRRQQLSAVQQSVQNAVIHCYALEGSYPPNLDYLAKNYGLVIDKKHYIYDYSIFASNIPPEIHIFRKQ